MKRVVAVLASVTTWAILGALAGVQYGYLTGYSRGVRDIGQLIIIWRDGQEPPAPFTQGEI